MRYYDYCEEGLNIRDGVCGVVIGGCNSGVFVRLEDGQEAFASFGRLEPGTHVLCTVQKHALGRWLMSVSIDSVEEDAVAA